MKKLKSILAIALFAIGVCIVPFENAQDDTLSPKLRAKP